MKTKNEDQRWLHYITPEYASSECGEGRGRSADVMEENVWSLSLFAATEITPAADIYAFGLCMLEVRACHVTIT